ncbi:MAG: hypothetical protein ACD_20C00144G0002 [uncultured bacterium]|uniref:Uncharacterized protein n=1 Tax=Candidatus Daviesbacteria bacterium RIFCSPHIGHO2_01_FULL_40_11 TaxID=1797762 RepID=A0A1F5JJH3_9BACT|nr:MAG: hypothetical protein ACD_20C00144G0002 [uncultured bacterium]OGE28759.1 MAG: hypothetical protein A2867_04740 [Candidatus Daviesbacteria bacterium RIFCSPHIGHO2_01_FULL_40_11]OGE62739.1 MAG: hypothetical protein A2964_00455 [Candidatus Daviesbacteria bacterium RIFCSPLOWO2_01_FULL_40_27]
MRSSEYRPRTPEPKALYAPYITELGIAGLDRERSLTLRLCGAASVGAAMGVAVGVMIGVVAAEIPIDRIASSPEAIGFIGKVSGLFGLSAAGWGAAVYYAEH